VITFLGQGSGPNRLQWRQPSGHIPERRVCKARPRRVSRRLMWWSVPDQSRRHRPPGTAASRPGALRRCRPEGAGRSRRASRTTTRPGTSSGGRSRPSLRHGLMPRPHSSSNTQTRPKSTITARQQRTKLRVKHPVGFKAGALPLGDCAAEVGLTESRRRVHGPVLTFASPPHVKVSARSQRRIRVPPRHHVDLLTWYLSGSYIRTTGVSMLQGRSKGAAIALAGERGERRSYPSDWRAGVRSRGLLTERQRQIGRRAC
jgi:hypothetical protein